MVIQIVKNEYGEIVYHVEDEGCIQEFSTKREAQEYIDNRVLKRTFEKKGRRQMSGGRRHRGAGGSCRQFIQGKMKVQINNHSKINRMRERLYQRSLERQMAACVIQFYFRQYLNK